MQHKQPRLAPLRRGRKLRRLDQNPTHGTVAFDNVLIAQLTLFVCTTLEGWSEVMFDASDAYSTSVARIFFFLAIIILGLFIFKLVVAVVYIRFDKTKSLDSKKKSFLEQTREKSRRPGDRRPRSK